MSSSRLMRNKPPLCKHCGHELAYKNGRLVVVRLLDPLKDTSVWRFHQMCEAAALAAGYRPIFQRQRKASKPSCDLCGQELARMSRRLVYLPVLDANGEKVRVHARCLGPALALGFKELK